MISVCHALNFFGPERDVGQCVNQRLTMKRLPKEEYTLACKLEAVNLIHSSSCLLTRFFEGSLDCSDLSEVTAVTTNLAG